MEIDRGWRGLTTLDCDTRETDAIKRKLKHRQYCAVRDAQLYLGATLLRMAGDDVLMRHREREFLIDAKGRQRAQE